MFVILLLLVDALLFVSCSDLCPYVFDFVDLGTAVVSERFCFHICQDGCYQMDSLPATLGTRTNFKTGGHLFIRPCYIDMAKVFFDTMAKDGPDVVPFIGTAGIGKSCLFLYILMQWFQKERLQSFYYQISQYEIHLFEVTLQGTLKVSTIVAAGSTLKAAIPLFVDMQEQTLPKHHPGKVFIFSSFQPKRYKEITKEKFDYTVPTWSEWEYATYMSFNHFWTDRGLDMTNELHCGLVKRSITVYGGSFRYVIVTVLRALEVSGLNVDWKVESALQTKGASTADCVFMHGFHSGDADISDVLIHRNPPVNNVGSFVYGAPITVYTVASSYIFQKLLAFKSDQYSAQMKQKFNGGMFGGGDDGKLFEYLCLNVFQFAGKDFNIASLSSNARQVIITVPATKTILTPNWRTIELQQDILYVPSHDTLESGDAFCLLSVLGVLTVIVLQITIDESHPVKMNGLRVIADRFPNAVQQLLVFVTPQNGKLCQSQNMLTTESKVAQRFDGVQGFNDNQFKLEDVLM